jgi:hypothetical protein
MYDSSNPEVFGALATLTREGVAGQRAAVFTHEMPIRRTRSV